MTDFTEIITPTQFTKSGNSNYSVTVQMKAPTQFECVPRDTEKSEFLDLVHVGEVAFAVETIILTAQISSDLCHCEGGHQKQTGADA